MSEAGHLEDHRQISDGWARAAIFGVSDGLVTNVSLIMGFSGAHPGNSVVRLAGLAGLVAGAFSMGSGEYLSVLAQKELFEREIAVERRAIADNPESERQELFEIFKSRGIEPDLASRLASELMKDPDLALRTHTREELGIDESAVGSPWKVATWSLLSFAVGALFPLLPWLFFSNRNPVLWSIALGAVGTIIVGGVVGKFTERGMLRTGLRQFLVTSLAALVTYSVGRLVGH